MPRIGDGAAASDMNQAVLCHRVLRIIQLIVTESLVLEEETWDGLLLLLVAINNSLLAPPIISSMF